MNEETLIQLRDIIENTRGASHGDLKQVVAKFLGAVKDVKMALEDEIKSCQDMMSSDKNEMRQNVEYLNKCMSDMEKMMKEHQKEARQFTIDELKTFSNNILGKIKDIEDNMPSMPDLSVYEAKLEQIKASIPDIKDTILDTPQQIRDKLEKLKNEERLDKSAIRGLEEEIDRLRKEINDSRRTGGTTIFGGVKTRFIDDETLSGTINGVNTIFTISKNPVTGSLKVFRGGARQRVTEDYTFDGNKTITFTIAPVVGEVLLADYRY